MVGLYNIDISIHSLRVEGDAIQQDRVAWARISIHSLRVEGDFVGIRSFPEELIFQSTPSVWRETKYTNRPTLFCAISIHSLRVEGDSDHRLST